MQSVCVLYFCLLSSQHFQEWKDKGDSVLHIEVHSCRLQIDLLALKELLFVQLRKWADLLVIAPLDANTMAKMATGLCDNLLVYWST